METKYDLIVLGAGPAGQKAALQAAKLGKRVCVVERGSVVGGACVSTGTLPSKTLRETVHYLAGIKSRRIRTGRSLTRQMVTFGELLERKSEVINHEIDIIQAQLDRNGVDVVFGSGRFADEHTAIIETADGMTSRLTGDRFIIATGSRPNIPAGFESDDPRVINSDSVLDLDDIPYSLAVVGGGVIGCEYASIFSRLGTKVTLIDRRTRILRFLDGELTDALAYHMRRHDITLRLGEDFEPIRPNGNERVHIRLKSGKIISVDRVFYSMGRQSNTESLALDTVGIDATDMGLLKVNEHYQTERENIYAVGDVIGFPSLASTSMEQGRLAACHAFGEATCGFPKSFPYGIYTIPEISYCGATEEELTAQSVPYEVGRAEYSETARGQILSDHTGMLKMLFHRETLELLGVHIIGDSATELIHIGQAVIAHGGKINYFIDNVFNYPTLAECYKVAALNGINRL